MNSPLEDEEILEPAATTHEDKLAYLADIARELTVMAQQLGCTTLAGLLDVATQEAEIQSRLHRSFPCTGV